MIKLNKKTTVLFLVIFSLCFPVTFAAAGTAPPTSTARLIFIHHSTGGNWLADANTGPYGGLGTALKNNNYYVSATNYGWGPGDIGSRTDIPHWPEWFTGANSTTILNLLYSETGQNFQTYGSWSRLAADPGGENRIIMFKSCFPNSDLSGSPGDLPLASPVAEQYSVANAKAVYIQLLTYFETRQDKLFAVITAPPQNRNDYSADSQTPEQRSANARAFNEWLMNNWLSGYAHTNVFVFDYFNVLTHPDNHHRIVGGLPDHTTSSASGNFAYYPAGEWDSHPNSTGHQKATAEFVPLLNYHYNQWAGGSPVVAPPSISSGLPSSVTAHAATLNGTVNPNGAETTWHFEYGTTTAYGLFTSNVSAGSGSAGVPVSAAVSGLDAATDYHWRLVASNAEGTTEGSDQAFSTPDPSPPVKGNIDGSPDGVVNLADAIMGLQVSAGMAPAAVVLAAEVNNDGHVGLAEAVYALKSAAGLDSALLGPADFQYIGAFRLPGGDTPPLTFAYGGNAMTFNPDGDPGNTDSQPGSLFITGHDRLPYGDLPDGSQMAEISIPPPVISSSVAGLPIAGFIQNFNDATAGYFTAMEEIPKTGIQYLNHPDTGPKIHIAWGQHLQPENQASHGWFSSILDSPAMQCCWFIGSQNLYSTNGYMFDIPGAWADLHANGRYLATGRMRDGGQGGMGPTLFAYRPWLAGGAAPAAGTHIEETPLLLYENAYNTEEIIRCMNGYQHPDEWEGGAWITTPAGKSAVLFSGTKGTGTKYWYGYMNPSGPESPCVDDHVTDFTTCRMADGSPCPAEDLTGCCDEADEDCITYRGWWSTRFDARFILYDPADLAKVAAGEMDAWEPQPYAAIDIDDRLYLDAPVWDQVSVGSGVQRRYRIGAAAYDRINAFLYVLELYADGGKPVVHVWQIQ